MKVLFSILIVLIVGPAVAENLIPFNQRCLPVVAVFPCTEANASISASCTDANGNALGAGVVAVQTDPVAREDTDVVVSVGSTDLECFRAERGEASLCPVEAGITGTFLVNAREEGFFRLEFGDEKFCTDTTNVTL